MSVEKKSVFDRWMDKKVENVVETSADALSRKLKIYLTAFYLVSMLVFVTYSIIALNNIGKMSDVLMYVIGGVFYAVFVVMAVLSIWSILKATNGIVGTLNELNKLYLASKVMRRVLGLVTYVLTVITLFQTWDQGLQYRLFSSIMLIAFTVGNLWIVVSDIFDKRLAKQLELKRLQEEEARRNATIKNKVKSGAEWISASVAQALKSKTNAENSENTPVVNINFDDIREELDAWEKKIFDVLNACYDKAIVGIPKMEEPVKEVASKYMLKYTDVNKAVSKYVAYQQAKCGTSGFVTGLGGLLTLPVAVPANLASVIYMQLRTITTIACMYGHDPKDEYVRTLAYACLTGNAMTDILASVGIVLGENSPITMVDKLPIAVLSKINKKVCLRLATKASEKGVASMAKFIPLLGGVIGGTVDVVATQTIASNAKKVFSQWGESSDVDVVEIKSSDFEW